MRHKVIPTAVYQREVCEAAGRLGAIEALELQFSVVVSMLRAMYEAHPERASVRRNFERQCDLLLTSPDTDLDSDGDTLLRDMAATLLLPHLTPGVEDSAPGL